MKLPDNFSFSQYNLQDYVDCKFRFLLRHINLLEWPAIESEPMMLQETRVELGQQFHRLVQQYFVGLNPQDLSQSIQIPELADWWNAFLSLRFNEQPGVKRAEKLLSISLHGQRLLAKYDLLLQDSAHAFTIYDWKTSNHQPSAQQLRKRLQIRIYPLVLWFILLSSSNPSITSPEIEMTYWFPTFPETPRRFEYTQADYELDMDYLTRLIDEILNMEEEEFTRTPELKRCAYCRYRSLCDRGISAGKLAAGEENDATESDFIFDFDAL